MSDESTEISKTNYSEYLTFVLDNEEYGLPILSVIDIRGWEEPTRVPNCPIEMKGIINIRGNIVPIIDLREKFGMNKKDYNKFTVTIVVKIKDRSDNEKVIGYVVDGVSDVYKFEASSIKPAPESSTINKSYISSLAVVNEKIIILLKPSNLAMDIEDLELT